MTAAKAQSAALLKSPAVKVKATTPARTPAGKAVLPSVVISEAQADLEIASSGVAENIEANAEAASSEPALKVSPKSKAVMWTVDMSPAPAHRVHQDHNEQVSGAAIQSPSVNMSMTAATTPGSRKRWQKPQSKSPGMYRAEGCLN